MLKTYLKPVARKVAWQEIPLPAFHVPSLILALLIGRMLAVGYQNYIALLIPVFIALIRFFDHFGRLVTRLSQRPFTPWDYVQTTLLDWLVEAAILTGLAFNVLVNRAVVTVTLVTVLLTEFTGVLTRAAGADQRERGLVQQRDRLILLGCASLFIPWLTVGRFAMIVSILLMTGCVITISQRLFYARKKLQRENKR